VHTSLVGMPYC